MKKLANLRVCASCEWIFKLSEYKSCPKCGFAHYGAFYVYGSKCYKFAKTQEPWFNRKVDNYKVKLWQEISAPNKVLQSDGAVCACEIPTFDVYHPAICVTCDKPHRR